jgi:trimethylamine---corrinoid protein Co-methyltransferase
MRVQIQVLSDDECNQVHDRSLKLLSRTGMRVLSRRARTILAEAGAQVDDAAERVRFPRTLIEGALRQAPRQFRLGGRRPDWDLDMNIGECSLLADGGAVSVLDWESGEIRAGTFDDWVAATKLIDTIDEIGIYWNVVEGGFADSRGEFVAYYRNVLKNCSKHLQDSADSPEKARLLLQILEIVFGGRDTVRSKHPFSYLLCPVSPLTIDSKYTDAYLETIGWDMPVAIMPMPLMGATAPASLISTLLVANAEFLAMLCLVQAAAPGTGTLYATAPQAIEPHSWKYTGGAVENSLFGAAVTGMGRYYGLPVEAETGGTDQYYPGAQAGYERALNWALPTIAWPDVLVGPGLLGGSTILCLEQMVMDVEVFRLCERLHEGFLTTEDRWLDEILQDAGPGANFLGQKSTLQALHEGRFYLSQMGFHGTYEKWKAAGMPDIVDEIQDVTRSILKKHHPLPLDQDVDAELERLERRNRELERQGGLPRSR